jgi:hypothetical protein
VKLLTVGVMAAASYGIDLAADTIAADKAAIENDTNEINGYTTDAQNCAVIVQSFSSLINQMSAVSTAVTSILTQWNTMTADITTAVNAASQALTDTDNAAYAAALTDIQNASSAWTTVDTLAQSLVLPSNVSQGEFQAGMTSAQVLSLVTSSPSTPIVPYLIGVTQAAA